MNSIKDVFIMDSVVVSLPRNLRNIHNMRHNGERAIVWGIDPINNQAQICCERHEELIYMEARALRKVPHAKNIGLGYWQFRALVRAAETMLDHIERYPASLKSVTPQALKEALNSLHVYCEIMACRKKRHGEEPILLDGLVTYLCSQCLEKRKTNSR